MLEKLKNAFDSISLRYDKLIYLHFLLTGVATYPLYKCTGNVFFHLSGGLCSVIAGMLDERSTTPVIELMNKPEFKEKNLSQHYREKNKIIGRNPTIKSYRKRMAIKHIATTLISIFFPNVGYAYLSAVPFIVRNNNIVKNNLKEDLESITEA